MLSPSGVRYLLTLLNLLKWKALGEKEHETEI